MRLDVSDTGVGMDAATVARIFEPLFTTKGDAGSGMGLAVARGLVEAHGGRLDVDSAPGHGTRFSLLLPVMDLGRSASPDPDSGPARRDAPPPVSTATASLRVLVVDDEARVRTVTARLLALRGHTVVEAGSGAQALERLAAAAASATPFDAVVTDFGMPGMDGLALATHVAARWTGLPVVLLTGDTEAGLDDPSGLLAARLAKPFRAAALDAALRRATAP